MRKSIVFIGSGAAMLAAPLVASAQTNTVTVSQGLIGLIRFANTALNDVIVLLITAAIVAFFWGMVQYILQTGRGNDEERKKGIQTMIWCIVAIFVMVSIWGLIHLLQSTFGVSSADSAQAPSALQIQ